jgi:ATP-dependent protease ClpP protease subunit
MMIHDASGLTIGNASDMRQMADLLDELSNTIATIYADRAGGTTASWRTAMQAETWYGASEAVKAGLADRVANDTTAAPENLRSQRIRARARITLRG